MIFMEIPKWSWHYDPALDSLVLIARSSFRLYVFFHRPFSILVVSWHFDPRRPYANFPLHLAHPPYYLEPATSVSSMEMDPSKERSPTTDLHVAESCSSSTSIDVLPEIRLEEDPEEPVLENGFHTL